MTRGLRDLSPLERVGLVTGGIGVERCHPRHLRSGYHVGGGPVRPCLGRLRVLLGYIDVAFSSRTSMSACMALTWLSMLACIARQSAWVRASRFAAAASVLSARSAKASSHPSGLHRQPRQHVGEFGFLWSVHVIALSSKPNHTTTIPQITSNDLPTPSRPRDSSKTLRGPSQVGATTSNQNRHNLTI